MQYIPWKMRTVLLCYVCCGDMLMIYNCSHHFVCVCHVVVIIYILAEFGLLWNLATISNYVDDTWLYQPRKNTMYKPNYNATKFVSHYLLYLHGKVKQWNSNKETRMPRLLRHTHITSASPGIHGIYKTTVDKWWHILTEIYDDYNSNRAMGEGST